MHLFDRCFIYLTTLSPYLHPWIIYTLLTIILAARSDSKAALCIVVRVHFALVVRGYVPWTLLRLSHTHVIIQHFLLLLQLLIYIHFVQFCHFWLMLIWSVLSRWYCVILWVFVSFYHDIAQTISLVIIACLALLTFSLKTHHIIILTASTVFWYYLVLFGNILSLYLDCFWH